jgi:hypothetical protein
VAKTTKLTVKFPELDRETQNKVRYVEEEGDNQVVGKLYLSKDAAKKLGNPDSITVTIEAD